MLNNNRIWLKMLKASQRKCNCFFCKSSQGLHLQEEIRVLQLPHRTPVPVACVRVTHFNSRVPCLLWVSLEDGAKHSCSWLVAPRFWETDSTAYIRVHWGTSPAVPGFKQRDVSFWKILCRLCYAIFIACSEAYLIVSIFSPNSWLTSRFTTLRKVSQNIQN